MACEVEVAHSGFVAISSGCVLIWQWGCCSSDWITALARASVSLTAERKKRAQQLVS